MMRMGLLLALTASVAIGCQDRRDDGAIGTSGETTNNDMTRPIAANGGVADSDRDFVNAAALTGMAEVELGRLALQHASSPSVKQFGQMMVDDHSVSGQRLATVATQNNIGVPVTLDEQHRALHTKLSALRGAEFDREYMDAMVDGHENLLDKLEARIDKANLADWKTRMGEAMRLKSPPTEPPAVVAETSDNAVTQALNQWAAGAYPTTYRHHESAKTIHEALNRGPARTQ